MRTACDRRFGKILSSIANDLLTTQRQPTFVNQTLTSIRLRRLSTPLAPTLSCDGRDFLIDSIGRHSANFWIPYFKQTGMNLKSYPVLRGAPDLAH